MDDMAKKSASAAPAAELAQLPSLDLDELVRIWKVRIGRKVPLHLPRYLLVRLLAYRLQAQASGNLDRSLRSQLEQFVPEKLAAHWAKTAALVVRLFSTSKNICCPICCARSDDLHLKLGFGSASGIRSRKMAVN